MCVRIVCATRQGQGYAPPNNAPHLHVRYRALPTLIHPPDRASLSNWWSTRRRSVAGVAVVRDDPFFYRPRGPWRVSLEKTHAELPAGSTLPCPGDCDLTRVKKILKFSIDVCSSETRSPEFITRYHSTNSIICVILQLV